MRSASASRRAAGGGGARRGSADGASPVGRAREDADDPLAERRMGVVEHPRQAVELGELDRLLRQAGGVLAAVVQDQRPEAERLDVEVVALGGPRRGIGPLERRPGRPPVTGGDRRVSPGQVAVQLRGFQPEGSARRPFGGDERVDPRQQTAAGFRAIAPGMQHHLFGQAHDPQPRQAALHADGIEPPEQLERPGLAPLRRDPGERAEGELDRIGHAAPLEHVEPVGQRQLRVAGLVALPQRRRQQRREHAGEGVAPAEIGVRLQQRRPEDALGQQDLSLPQVAEADDEFAPPAEVPGSGVEIAPRRTLLTQPRHRGLAIEQRTERRAVGVNLQQPRVGQRRVHGPGIVQRREPVGVVGEDRGPGADQGAFAAELVVDVVARQHPRHQALRLLVAFADRERPGGGEQQSRTGVGFGARDDAEPPLNVVEPPPSHQRVVEAALRQLAGPVAPPRRQGVPRGGGHQAVGGQPLRGAGVGAGSLFRRGLADGRAARPGRGHAAASSRSARRRRAPAWRRRCAAGAPPRPAPR